MKVQTMSNKERTSFLTFILLVFSFFFIFFFYLHPISISDTDDWIFLTYHRDAWPIWGGWNPIRVFAEVTIPAISSASAVLIYPVIGNIFTSLSLGYAVCIAAAVTCLAFALYRLNKKNLSVFGAIAVTVFFLACHFWIFRTAYQDNDYMLRTADACTVFYYVIPNLLNAVLVLWMEMDSELVKWDSGDKRYAKKSLFVLLVYFCIFSNIWAGMIIAAYVGSRLLFSLRPLLQKQKKLTDWLTENRILLILIAIWIVSQIFEMNGGRADMVEKEISKEIGLTITTLLRTARSMNRKFAAVIIALLLIGIAVQIMERKKEELKTTAFWGTCFFISCIYLILSCSKVGHGFAARPDVFYGLFFFGLMAVVVNAVYLSGKYQKTKVLILLLLLIILNDCSSGGRTFRESNMLNLSPRIINNINNDIVDQLMEAEDLGLSHTEIKVPVFDDEDNWPYAVYATDALGESMWKLHVIEQNVRVDSIIPSSEKDYLLSIGTRGKT